MMKFSAIVALVLFATADASSVTSATITRGTTLLAGADGGSLIITFTTGAGAIATGNTVKFTPIENNAAYFTADGSASCTAVGAGTNAVTNTVGTAVASSGVLSVVITGTVAASTVCTITCTSNLAVNAAKGAKTFALETTLDSDSMTPTGYSTTSAVTAFSASTGTSLVSGVAPGNLVFGFTATTALAASGVITLTSSKAIFTASVDVACTAAVTGVTTANVPTFVAASTESDATGKILTLTLAAGGNDILAATGVITITCTDNMLVNPTAGAVTFTVGTTTDVGPSAALTGYTISAATSAASSTASVGMLTMLALAGVAMRQ